MKRGHLAVSKRTLHRWSWGPDGKYLKRLMAKCERRAAREDIRRLEERLEEGEKCA